MSQIVLSGSIGSSGVAILGSVNIVMIDANHTLSVSESTNNFLNCSSSVSLTATRSIIAPLNEGQSFVVQNTTTGGQSIQIIGATGTGIVIPTATTTIVVCDGTNYISVGGNVSGAAGGDLSGSYPSPVVININGASIPISGALVTGNVLQVSGTSALSYGPVNLAGGSHFVSGSLPSANQVAQTMAGDVTGNTGAAVVVKINGVTVSGTPASGNIIVASSPTAASWTTAPSGFTAGGDLTGSSTSQNVIKLQGNSIEPGTLTSVNDGYVLTWNNSVTQWQPKPTFLGGGGALTGLSTARPSATGSGEIYYCTDIPVLYVDDPSSHAWMQFASEYLPKPLAISSYTAVGDIAIYQRADTIYAAATNNASVNCCSIAVTPGSLSNTSTWTVNFCATGYLYLQQQYPQIGVCVSNGTTINSSAMWALCMLFSGSTSGIHGVNSTIGNGTRLNTYNEALGYQSYLLSGTGRLHFRLLNDGLNLHMQCSPDGFLFQDWVTITCPTGLTDYGFFLGTDSGSTNSYGQMLIYENSLGSISAPQQTISAATGSGVAVQITVGSTAGYLAGDAVAIRGMLGNTILNQGTGNLTGTSGRVVHSIDNATQMTFNETGNGTYTGGGIVTLLSR